MNLTGNFTKSNHPITHETTLHVVDNKGIQEIINANPFNKNIDDKKSRDINFPELFDINNNNPTYFIICNQERQIIAAATLARLPHDKEHELTLSQISVGNNQQNKGYATHLLHQIKDHLNNNRPDITTFHISSLSIDGTNYLAPKVKKMANEFNATIYIENSRGICMQINNKSPNTLALNI